MTPSTGFPPGRDPVIFLIRSITWAPHITSRTVPQWWVITGDVHSYNTGGEVWMWLLGVWKGRRTWTFGVRPYRRLNYGGGLPGC